MSNKNRRLRQATQCLTCRAVLSRYLNGEELERAVADLRVAMRTGESSWAFKPPVDTPPAERDDRIYYTSGGNT